MRVVTWNVNSLRVRLEQVTQMLQQLTPDVVCLQETKVVDALFPLAELEKQGYHCFYSGQPAYNGVATLVKTGLTSAVRQVSTCVAGFDDPQKRFLALSIHDFQIVNLYIPNGQSTESEKYHYKLNWLDQIFSWVKDQSERFEKLCVVGDFNIAPADADVHDVQAWHEKIMCSTPERSRLQNLLQQGCLSDIIPQHAEAQQRFTWWDYRAAAFRRKMGMRIDLTLVSQALAEEARSQVALDFRKLPKASDHAPVVLDLILPS